jgi:hypothetical protein
MPHSLTNEKWGTCSQPDSAGCHFSLRLLHLEAQKRSEGYAQIVMCGPGKINFIAGIQA